MRWIASKINRQQHKARFTNFISYIFRHPFIKWLVIKTSITKGKWSSNNHSIQKMIGKPCTSMRTGFLTVESSWTNWLDLDNPLMGFHGSSYWCGLKVSDLELIISCPAPELGKRCWESCIEQYLKEISFQRKQLIMGHAIV